LPTTLPDVVVATAPGRPVAIVLPAVAAGGTLAGNGQPAGGIVAVDPAGQGLTYTPWDGFLGVDAFAYAVGLAGTGAPAEGRVLVTVAVPNAAPVANDDAASTRPGAAVLVPVLANDSDPDGDPLSLAAVVMSGHGTVAVDADQRRLRYVPQAGFVGRDSFAYAVSDGRGGVSAATVSVAVEAANGRPVARDDAALAVAGAPVTVAVLANDSDPDGDPLRLTGLGLPARGTLAANPDQSVTYTPPPATSARRVHLHRRRRPRRERPGQGRGRGAPAERAAGGRPRPGDRRGRRPVTVRCWRTTTTRTATGSGSWPWACRGAARSRSTRTRASPTPPPPASPGSTSSPTPPATAGAGPRPRGSR
jgi:hypothetical protein